MNYTKESLLTTKIEHLDITSFNSIPLIESFEKMSFQARNLARSCRLFDQMLQDKECTVILCLAGSLISAGLKKAIKELITTNMVDIIVSTGAVLVDQDFFEALGFHHYKGTIQADDHQLQQVHIDRIYDTYIDEDDLRVCDDTIKEIADNLPAGVYSSREFIWHMGEYLHSHDKPHRSDSVVYQAYAHDVPIFCPAFSDSSAGFGLVFHQQQHANAHVAIDSVKDFRELTKLKVQAQETGLVMIGGGVPKNFVQDTVVAADILGIDAPMHKYAIQITVADERDGALSGSTLKEAHSWGKVDEGFEQMVFSEATIAFPLLASYVYFKESWKNRNAKQLSKVFATPLQQQ